AYEPFQIDQCNLSLANNSNKTVKAPLKIYAENDQIVRHLTCDSFEQVDDMETADIWWLQSHFKDFRDFDNTWIIKPWNLARSLDTFVTNNLTQIIRLIDSGPKVACKYIDDPVLFHRPDVDAWVKFDLRFIVFLKSVKPLKLYVYNNFWIRFALKQFSLDNFDDVEKHFTVFNYLDKDKILQMKCEEFAQKFSNQYPGQEWPIIEEEIHKVIKSTFEVATKHGPPKGLADLAQSRAMYGLDLMLKWSTNSQKEKYVQPVIIEVNYMPDCERACQYYPNFADVVFKTLFLEDNQIMDLPVTQL
uniref:Tubulin--tyrosine ligase-like protein 12 n=1 Tax=Romanomermis culicivorax TaxID=13658 RepID=A0A915HG09_ROMCU